MTEIVILETGGTINGILEPGTPSPATSRVVDYLSDMSDQLSVRFSSEIIVMKDSRALESEDRTILADAVRKSARAKILIPHGTYTMPETGRFLQEALGDAANEKTVVLVGSMIPLGETDSDAPANLQFAIDNLKNGPAGVWVAMNGRLWDPKSVMKDPETGEFREKNVA